MKIMIYILAVVAVTMAGCAASEKTLSSPAPVRAFNDPAEQATDDDFDLLEEEFEQKTVEVADPLEPVNRVMYHVNDAFYFWLLKPVTQVYTHVAPEPVRIGIGNFFGNLTTPIRFVNCHLQGKRAVADIELKRFWVNTTAGVLGFGDPAKDRHDLAPPAREDLGQTIATYGVGNGFYIVLPLFGPSTLRDSVGMVGDMFLSPVFYVEPTGAAVSISATRITNETSFHIGEYEAFKADALDPYVAMRSVYIQYRTQKIKEQSGNLCVTVSENPFCASREPKNKIQIIAEPFLLVTYKERKVKRSSARQKTAIAQDAKRLKSPFAS